MAFKKYAYYMRGNKLAIVESSSRSSSGFKAVAHCTIGGHSTKDACEAAGGQWIPSSGGHTLKAYEQWQSPLEDITDGLEIEYAYSPTYWVSDELKNMSNKFWLNGWTIKDGYLSFIRSHISTAPDWSSSPYNAVAANENILIKNSDRWNGIHKVQAVDNGGLIQTYTKVNQTVVGVTGSSNIDIGGEATVNGVLLSKINANNASNIWLGNIFEAGDYIYIYNTTTLNAGLWQIHSIDVGDGSQEEEHQMYIKNKVYVPIILDESAGITSVEEEYVDTSPNTTAVANSSALIYGAYRDHCYAVSDVNVMEDESFDLDMDSYICKAIVYYLKARMAEDAMDIEKKEYFMREFHSMLDKQNSSQITAIRQIQAPITGVR